ncbi:MAG: CDP-alcohol phosphatidyltransferase family protein [Prevotella sp.]|jgi:CDP-diacylglycerol--serine O-phosphatidyltransferase
MSIKKHIPNTITCCNLISGCIATYYAFVHDPWMALAFVIIGAVFDFFDGMAARLLHVSSPIGKELDSLADDITFGMAPSTIIFSELTVMDYPGVLLPVADYVPFVAYVMAAFSALRLAKFNLDERQSLGFIGLPTPANALFWGSLIVGAHGFFEASPALTLLLILMMFVSCYLLVAEIPMFALKFKQWGWKGNEVKYIFLLSCIPLLIIFKITAFAIIIAWYVVLSIAVNLYNRQRSARQRK